MTNIKHYRELIKDAFQYLTLSGVLETSNILLLPILTRAFSRSAYGLIDGLTLIIALSSTIIGMTMPSAITRLYHEEAEHERPRLVSSMLFIVVVSGLVVIIGVMAVVPIFQTYFDKVEDGAQIIVLAVLAGFMSALFSVVSVLFKINRRIIICQILSLTLLVGYVAGTCFGIYVLKAGVESVLYATIISSLICTIWALWSARKYISCRGPSWYHMCSLTIYAWPLMIANIAAWINLRGSRSIMILQLGLFSSGIYAAGTRIAALVGLAVNAFQQAWSYYSMMLLKKGGFQSVTEGILRHYTGVVSIMAIALLAFAHEIVRMLAGPGYIEAVVVLPWIVGGTILRGIASVVNAAAIIQCRSRTIGMAYIFSAAINILLMFLLISIFGLRGAAIAYFLSELCAVVYFAYDTSRRSEVVFKWKQIMPNFIIYLIVSNALVWNSWMDEHLGIRILVAVTACALIFRSIGVQNVAALLKPQKAQIEAEG